jgi:uncharacterized membrane protein YebE (DUF533 family)
VLNNPADILSIVLRGALGRSGRKRARRATSFLTGKGGFLTASTVMAAAGVAWGIYDSVKGQNVPGGAAPGNTVLGGTSGAVAPAAFGVPPPIPAGPDNITDPLLQLVRLAVSASRADGALTDQERELILNRAKEAGLDSVVEAELTAVRPLSDIVRGVNDPATKKDFYVLAFTIVRADETVSGAERIYLAQLAHSLGLDPAAVTAIETETAAKIDAQPDSGL